MLAPVLLEAPLSYPLNGLWLHGPYRAVDTSTAAAPVISCLCASLSKQRLPIVRVLHQPLLTATTYFTTTTATSLLQLYQQQQHQTLSWTRLAACIQAIEAKTFCAAPLKHRPIWAFRARFFLPFFLFFLDCAVSSVTRAVPQANYHPHHFFKSIISLSPFSPPILLQLSALHLWSYLAFQPCAVGF